MNFDFINRTLQAHFKDNWSRSPVEYANTHFDAPKTPWMRFQVLPNNTEYASIGSVGQGVKLRNPGLIAITAFVPKESTQTKLYQNLDAAAALFFGVEISSIQCYEPQINEPSLIGGWHQCTVFIPFQYDSIH